MVEESKSCPCLTGFSEEIQAGARSGYFFDDNGEDTLGLFIEEDYSFNDRGYVSYNTRICNVVWDYHNVGIELNYSGIEKKQHDKCEVCSDDVDETFKMPIFLLGTRDAKIHEIAQTYMCRACIQHHYSWIDQTLVEGSGYCYSGFFLSQKAFYVPKDIKVTMDMSDMETIFPPIPSQY